MSRYDTTIVGESAQFPRTTLGVRETIEDESIFIQ